MAEKKEKSRIGYMFSAIRFIVIWNLVIDINFFKLVYDFAVHEDN